jgi:hypothetical protein
MTPTTPPIDPRYVAVMVRTFVKGALSLLFALVYFVLLFGTNLAQHFGNRPKGQALGLALVTLVPFALAFPPLAWLAERVVRRRLAQQQSTPTSGAI